MGVTKPVIPLTDEQRKFAAERGNEVDNKIKETLKKQLELLSERSHQKFTSDIGVAQLSVAMVEVAGVLKDADKCECCKQNYEWLE